ncbi:MAG: hypothetical protein AVO38_08505 [delta proteobacterium ML8_D]|nr:MAG: hypothetical protein AVO38_08505 [delta proteobacterium ML8_D]
MIPDGDRKINILDVGCGEGTLGKLLKGKFKDIHVVGCDISEKAAELARPYYDKIFQIDIDEDDLNKKTGEDTFDYIVCVEIIEHLLHPEVALKKCKKLLSKHGNLIVSFPNIAWWKYRIKLLKGHFPEESRLYHHAEHLHDFTMHTFTELLKEVGLESVEIGGEFIPPKFVECLKPKNLIDKSIRKYPNLFGYQIVIKTKRVTR